MSESEYVRLIEEARARNNRYWMGILKIALKHAPVETRLVLKQIKAGDLNVVYYTQKLADEAVEEAMVAPNAIVVAAEAPPNEIAPGVRWAAPKIKPDHEDQ